MSSRKRTTQSALPQSTEPAQRSQSDLDWNTRRKPHTPRGEYRFMRAYTMVWLQRASGGSFNPFDGGVSK
jgi:hypothetical protein